MGIEVPGCACPMACFGPADSCRVNQRRALLWPFQDAEWMESEHEQAAILVNTEPSVPEDDAVDLKAPEFEEVSLQCIRMQHRLGSDAFHCRMGATAPTSWYRTSLSWTSPQGRLHNLRWTSLPKNMPRRGNLERNTVRHSPVCSAHCCAARRRLSEIAARKRSMGSEEEEWLESEAAVMVEKQPAQ